MAAQSSLPGQDDNSTLKRIGDILHIALPGTAVATAALKGDGEGTLQSVVAIGATIGTFQAIKAAIGKDRPDISDQRSFPSGHTAMSFAGSTFMLRRYGKKVGIPMMLGAGFAGFTRVKGQKHFADDVIGGAGLGILYNLVFTKPYPRHVFLQPVTFDSGGAGVQMRIDAGRQETPVGSGAIAAGPKRFRVDFEYAALYTRSLSGQLPPGQGTPLALDINERIFTPTARFTFDWLFREPHELSMFWAPFEARDFERVSSESFWFGGVEFAGGEGTTSRFRFDEVALRYRYRLVDSRRLDFRLGAALSYRETRAAIYQEEPDLKAEVIDYEFLPLAHIHAEFHFTPGFSLVAEGDAMAISAGHYSASSLLGLRWRFSPRWAFTFGYRGLWRELTEDDIQVRTRFDYFVAGVGYSF